MVYCITNAPLKLQVQFPQRGNIATTTPSSNIQQSFIPVMQESNNS